MINNQTLEGDFTQDSIPNLMQFIGSLKASGELQLESGPLRATIYFAEGRVVDATHRNLLGQMALFQALTFPHGQFSFMPKLVSARLTPTIDGPLDRLLVEAANWQDHNTLERELEVIPSGSVPKLRASQVTAVNLQGRHIALLPHLNGELNIAEIAQRVQLDSVQLNLTLHELIGMGLVELETPKRDLLEPQALEEITQRLTGVIGPMAKVIVRGAVQSLNAATGLERQQLGPLLDAISRKLDAPQQHNFAKFREAILQRYSLHR